MSDWSDFGNDSSGTATIPLATNAAQIYDNFDRRLHRLEQLITGSVSGRLGQVEEGNFPDGIIVDGVPLGLTPPDAVTGVSATPGAFYENIFCDVEWTEAGTGVDAVSFDVDLAEKNAGPVYNILNVFNTAGTNIRLNNLEPNKNYSVRVVPVNGLGVRGAVPSWTDFTTGSDSTIPPAPTGVIIARGATTAVVKFTGLTEIQAPDVAWGHGSYEIEIDTSSGFASPDKRSQISSATVVAFNDIFSDLIWYARVRAIDSSGNTSVWSSTSAPAIAGGVNDIMIVADLSAAKITVGTMSGDRITANTLDAGRIKTSSITAANITLAGGAFLAGTATAGGGGTGVLINSQGIRLLKAGVGQIILDAATGNATFAGNITSTATIAGGTITGATITGATVTGGTIQTNTPGNERLVLTDSGSTPYGSLQYFSADASESERGYVYWQTVGSGSTRYPRVVIAPATFSGIQSDQGRLTLHGRTAGGGNSSATLSGDDVWLTAVSGTIHLEPSAGQAIILGDHTDIFGNLEVIGGSVTVGGGATIGGNTTITGNLLISGNHSAYGNQSGFAFRWLDASGNTIDCNFNGSQLVFFVNGVSRPAYNS